MLRNNYTTRAALKTLILLNAKCQSPGGWSPNWNRCSPPPGQNPQVRRGVAYFFFVSFSTQDEACPFTAAYHPGLVVRCVIFAPRKYTAADHAMTSA